MTITQIKMTRIINSIWFTNFIDEKPIWLVKVDTGQGIKFYIGTAESWVETEDELHIAKNWSPFYPDALEEFFNTK